VNIDLEVEFEPRKKNKELTNPPMVEFEHYQGGYFFMPNKGEPKGYQKIRRRKFRKLELY